MNNIYKKTKWSDTVKIITIVVSCILLWAKVKIILSLQESFDIVILIILAVITICVFILVLQIPKGVEINKESVILHKLLGKITISKREILEVSPYSTNKTEFRILGSGGLFGYIGRFYNSEIGFYYSYVGNYKQAFLIKTKKNNYVFSCTERDAIIQNIKEYT